MGKAKRQNAVFLFLFPAALLLFYWILLSGGLDYTQQEPVRLTDAQIYEDLKDFERTEEGLRSLTGDPWVQLTVPRGIYQKIDLEIGGLSQETSDCVIYYCLSEKGWYNGEEYVVAELTQGRVSIPLPEEEIDHLRLDLTSQTDVVIRIDGITMTPKVVSRPLMTIAIALLILLALLLLLIRYSGKAGVLLDAGYRRASGLIQKRPKVALGWLMGVSIVLCFGPYLVGQKLFAYMDIGSDTVLAYQPVWYALADDLQTGRPAQWTMNFGLGTSTLSQISWLLDPFLWPTLLTYKLFGFSASQIPVAWMQGVKLFLCAFLCYDYLSEFSIGNAAKILASFAYGFCGFVILWGQHYMFSTYFVIFTLVLKYLERSIRRQKLAGCHGLLALSVAWLAAKSYYFAYMSMLLFAVYTVIRLVALYGKEGRKLLLSGAWTLGTVILGFSISAVMFLPQINEVLTVSDRISGGIDLLPHLTLYSGDRLTTILARTLSNNLQGVVNYEGSVNYYEAEQLFFTSFLPLMLILYACGETNRKRAILRILGIGLLCLIPLTPLTGYIMNGFVFPVGRYTFVLAPVCAVITAKVIDMILNRQISRLALVLASLFSAGIVALVSNAAGMRQDLLCAIVLETVVLAALAAALSAGAEGAASKALRALLAAVLLINVVCESMITTNERTTLTDLFSQETMTQSTAEVKQIRQALEEKDPELFRIEKTYSDYTRFNDAMIEDYYGISAYNSTINGGIRTFFRNCWPDVVFRSDGIYTQFKQDYQNGDLAALLGIKYIVSSFKVQDEDYSHVMDLQGKSVYQNERYQGFARFYTGAMPEEQFLALPMEERQRALQENLVLETESLAPADGTATIVRPTRDDRIACDVSCTGEGWVFFPIPFEKGWTATVNGSPTEILKADFGFMAVPVSAGQSGIVLEYHIPLLKEGIILSLIGIAVLILFVVFIRIRRKRSK